MPIPFINRQPGKKPNSWEMNWGEHIEAVGLAGRVQDGPSCLQELTKARFDPIPALDDAGKIDACRQLTAWFKFSKEPWIRARVQEIESAVSNVDAAGALRDLYRGYSDSEKTSAVADARSRRSTVITRIDQAIQDNQSMAMAIPQPPQQTPGQRRHNEAYQKNVTK
jgi:hypothetical protein